jgi:hypothetical protein
MIAAHHHRCGPDAPGGTVSPPLHQRLQSSRAFRLTPGHTWSTDTASQTPMSVLRVETLARVRPSRSHCRAGGGTHALPEL